MGHQTPDLLPSPWTNYTPPLRNPFTSSNLPRSSSATNSPPCSPDASPTSTTTSRRHHRFSLNRMRSRSGSPFTMRSASASGSSSLRLSSLILRRRPSAVDLALSEERCRCSGDSVEKIGLGMMEPRPVDPMPMPVSTIMMEDTDMGMNSMDRMVDFEAEGSYYVDALRIGSQPRFVMGGIFEVMEGTA
ncbi:hypothetical protein FQN50_010048 [Emmonsiellopsis sp. PD_5]|nr:hypothetical protein FQN50_010048 [Emmonsiellopsis sp. PD_5]